MKRPLRTGACFAALALSSLTCWAPLAPPRSAWSQDASAPSQARRLAALEARVQSLLARVARLEDELARLKGGERPAPRPATRPAPDPERERAEALELRENLARADHLLAAMRSHVRAGDKQAADEDFREIFSQLKKMLTGRNRTLTPHALRIFEEARALRAQARRLP